MTLSGRSGRSRPGSTSRAEAAGRTLFLFIPVALLTLAAWGVFRGRSGLGWILLSHTGIIALGLVMRARPIDLFELSNLFLGAQFVSFVWGLYAVKSLESRSLINFVVDFNVTDIDYEIAFFSLLATVSFLLGYIVKGERRSPLPEQVKFPRGQIVSLFPWLMLISLAIYYVVMGFYLGGVAELIRGLYFVRGIGISYGLGLFQPLLTFGGLLLPYVLVFRFRCRLRAALTSKYVLPLAAVLVTSLVHNSRGALLAPILMYFVTLNYLGRLRLRGFAAAIAAMMVGIVTINGAFTTWIDPGRKGGEGTAESRLFNSFDAISGFGMVLKTFPDRVDFQYGTTFLEGAIYPFMPRLFFPNKPATYGNDKIWYLGGFNSVESGSQYALSQPGEWYAQFGFIGVVAGLFLFGAASRYAYDLFQRRRGSVVAILAYAYFVQVYQGMFRGAFPYVYMMAQSSLVIVAFWVTSRSPMERVSLRLRSAGPASRSPERRVLETSARYGRSGQVVNP